MASMDLRNRLKPTSKKLAAMGMAEKKLNLSVRSFSALSSRAQTLSQESSLGVIRSILEKSMESRIFLFPCQKVLYKMPCPAEPCLDGSVGHAVNLCQILDV